MHLLMTTLGFIHVPQLRNLTLRYVYTDVGGERNERSFDTLAIGTSHGGIMLRDLPAFRALSAHALFGANYLDEASLVREEAPMEPLSGPVRTLLNHARTCTVTWYGKTTGRLCADEYTLDTQGKLVRTRIRPRRVLFGGEEQIPAEILKAAA